MGRRRKAKPRSGKRAVVGAEESGAPEAGATAATPSAGLSKRAAVLIALAFAVPIAFVVVLVVLSQSSQQPAASTPSSSVAQPKAAIVDQLSVNQPNPDFAEAATSVLGQAGYAVDYFPGEQVTVDFYRDLPRRGYEVLIFRVHSALVGTGEEATDDATLYTTVPYEERKYVPEQAARRLSIVSYYEGGPEYFGITPEFVRSSMRGKFDESVVILMGCDSLKTTAAAEAFLQKGAKAVVGWSGPVSSTHTDDATERLLQHLLVDGLAVADAVAQTMTDVGPDPAYGSALVFDAPESVSSGAGEGYLAR